MMHRTISTYSNALHSYTSPLRTLLPTFGCVYFGLMPSFTVRIGRETANGPLHKHGVRELHDRPL
jgi:hypothetical protein